MYRGAIRSMLSELIRQERLFVVEAFGVDAPQTKQLLKKLQGLGLSEVLVVADDPDENLYLAARNLRSVDVRDVSEVDPVSLAGFEQVLITSAALKSLEERLT